MKNTLKLCLVYILLPVVAIALPFVFASGESYTSYDWYFKANDTHTRPAVCTEADFLAKFDDVIYMGADEKVIYLTFDAGFDNGNMAKILDTLKEKDVPATFFVDGNFVSNEPELVTRICSEGHILGNHSLSHADMSTLTDFDKYTEQIEGWNQKVIQAGGTPSNFFRFPCGRFSELSLQYNEKLGLKSVFWSFAYFDWETDNQPDATAALDKILSRTHNGCVMLLHSVSSTNAQILPTLIDTLREQGYSFASLEEI